MEGKKGKNRRKREQTHPPCGGHHRYRANQRLFCAFFATLREGGLGHVFGKLPKKLP